MELFSIVFFLVVLYGFGSSVSFIAKESDDFLERNLMRLGIGLGVMLLFGFLLNVLKIPLDWRIFLGLGILILIAKSYFDYRKNKTIIPKFNLNFYSILMLILFAITLYMYVHGAFAYPYLEDDDSWSHAMSVKYVSVEKTVFTGKEVLFHYIDPYPPAYDMLLGIVHQTNDSVYWTLKFFNALIISLSIIFFYYFVKVFSNSSKKAFFSTLALFAIPAYLSHFIWAIALTMPLFFVAFYCTEKIRDDRNWWIITALVIMPTVTSSPTHSAYFGLFFVVYFAARLIAERRFLIYEFLAGLSGVVLAFVLWWAPTIIEHGFYKVIQTINPRASAGILNVIGTGDRVYSVPDFLCGPSSDCYNGVNMINNPIGIGIVVSILALIGFIYLIFNFGEAFRQKNYYVFVSILWFVLALYAVNSAKMPVKISPFRAWMLFAVAAAITAGEAINILNNVVKSLTKNIIKNGKVVLLASFVFISIIIILVFLTSFIPKYKVNTAGWPPGAFWTSNEEIQGYVWFKGNCPSGAKVFTFSNRRVGIGMDKFICSWCQDVKEFQKTSINMTATEVYSKLKNDKYQYAVIDGQAAKKFGQNKTNNLISPLVTQFNLQPVFQNNGIIILKI